jgi:hypothetical protein
VGISADKSLRALWSIQAVTAVGCVITSYSEAQLSNPHSRPLPTWARVATALLLIIPVVALLLVPTYASETPILWGFPFFYWYPLMWMFIEAAMVYAAYLVINRARGNGGTR